METLPAESTREEVLAAVEDHDRMVDRLASYDEQIDFRGDPPETRQGCYSSPDGMVIACYGRQRDEPRHLVAQRRAGEEDQTTGAPEWGA